MATYYYDLSLGVNGTGISTSPFNVYPGTAVSAGDSHLFKRATTGSTNFALTSGANNTITRFGAWANADGSDNTGLARPIISTTAAMNTFATKKGHLRLENLDIRGTALTVANDAVLMYLSNSATVVNCNINTNIGGIGLYGCSNITIQSCTVTAVTHSNANNNQCLAAGGATDQTSIAIDSNTFLHGGGGGTTSHTINFECTSPVNAIKDPVFTNNYISTVASASSSNTYAVGLRLVRCSSASITGNTAKFHLSGMFEVGGGAVTAAFISSNTFVNNYHFGIHLTTSMVNCIIQYNTCSSNGTSINDGGALAAYGRGIELSSAAGQSSCASHTVRFNVCKSNLNYGGVNDNGSEGVGIGLDDGCVNCLIYGNDIQDNEGNGIQLYGGGNSATWTDTHNTIFANFFKNNCVNSVYNRRTGGTFRSVFCADINLAYTYGGPTVIANNLHAGSTSCGVAMGNSNRSVTCANNVMLNMANNFMDGRSTRAATDYRTNILFGTTNFQYVLDTVDGNSSPTYPIISGFQAQTDTITSNPLMSSGAATAWMPAPGSPAIAKGTIVTLATNDFQNNNYKSPPTIGMLEFVGPVTAEGGHRRKQCLARR